MTIELSALLAALAFLVGFIVGAATVLHALTHE